MSLVCGLCPGSFDPVTLGHTSVITAAAPLFEKLFVAVIENPSKKPLLSADERVRLLQGELAALRNVEVFSYDGLTVDAAAARGARWILRGVRGPSDLEHELPMAHTNRLCGKEPIETLFVPARPEVGFISSTLVREIAARGGDLASLVSPRVAEALRRRFA